MILLNVKKQRSFRAFHKSNAKFFKLYLLIYCFCIMYHECHIWFLRHFEDFFEIAISCICQINIIFLSFYINSLLYFMLFRYHLVVFSYLVFNMHKHSIFFFKWEFKLAACSASFDGLPSYYFSYWIIMVKYMPMCMCGGVT